MTKSVACRYIYNIKQVSFYFNCLLFYFCVVGFCGSFFFNFCFKKVVELTVEMVQMLWPTIMLDRR